MDGVDWRQWTAADTTSAMFTMLRRTLQGQDLRDLFELVGDRDALAALDRATMGQTEQVEAIQPGVRRGV